MSLPTRGTLGGWVGAGMDVEGCRRGRGGDAVRARPFGGAWGQGREELGEGERLEGAWGQGCILGIKLGL